MKKKNSEQQSNIAWIAAAVAIAFLIIVIAIVVLVPSEEEPTIADNAAKNNLYLSCAFDVVNVIGDTEPKRDSDYCTDWAERTLNEYLSEVRKCQEQFSEAYSESYDEVNEQVNMENFETCLLNNGVPAPEG